ncbi:MAG: hypothetical protein HY735_26305 [Verrucomicrobia bacterium]|nr:hypothetical protein [Verrucomicrobiota bacterium]
MHLIFFDRRSQVMEWDPASASTGPKTLVAVTASALQALEERGLPHEAISRYANFKGKGAVREQCCRESLALAQELESFMGERYAPARFDGPGFMTASVYHMQHAVMAIATRAFLIRETIRAVRPRDVTILSDQVLPPFSDEYTQNPWMEFFEGLTVKRGEESGIGRMGTKPGTEWSPRILDPTPPCHSASTPFGAEKNPTLRLLMAHHLGYDWAPVLEVLAKATSSTCFTLDGKFFGSGGWKFYFDSKVRTAGGETIVLNCETFRLDPAEARILESLFDDWLARRTAPPTMNVFGMDLFPAIKRYLRAMASIGPALARHADKVSVEVLEVVQPHAVCFFAMPWPAAKRLAYQCHLRRIPVVAFQHGGTPGTHVSPHHQLSDLSHADFFLTYGEGIRPPENPFVRVRATHVPVGSARIEKLIRQAEKPVAFGRLTVLWLGDISTENTQAGIEDTLRYRLQVECLRILSESRDLQVVYRPFPTCSLEAHATPQWIARTGRNSVRVTPHGPLLPLLLGSDIVICDLYSSTVWNEVLALKKPFILYCDPDQGFLRDHFMADLESACLWCKSESELVEAVRRLSTERHQFVSEVARIDPSVFLRKYVWHRGDGNSAARVVSFLHRVCRDGQSVETWQKAWDQESSVKAEQASRQANPDAIALEHALHRLNTRMAAQF